jgi:hypothetical protein
VNLFFQSTFSFSLSFKLKKNSIFQQAKVPEAADWVVLAFTKRHRLAQTAKKVRPDHRPTRPPR